MRPAAVCGERHGWGAFMDCSNRPRFECRTLFSITKVVLYIQGHMISANAPPPTPPLTSKAFPPQAQPHTTQPTAHTHCSIARAKGSHFKATPLRYSPQLYFPPACAPRLPHAACESLGGSHTTSTCLTSDFGRNHSRTLRVPPRSASAPDARFGLVLRCLPLALRVVLSYVG